MIGLIGSSITVGILFFGYSELVNSLNADITLAIKLIPIQEFAMKLSALIVGLGLLIGIWGSTMSIRKFLKV
ncbi:Cell division protein FtsX [compost metagenome]